MADLLFQIFATLILFLFGLKSYDNLLSEEGSRKVDEILEKVTFKKRLTVAFLFFLLLGSIWNQVSSHQDLIKTKAALEGLKDATALSNQLESSMIATQLYLAELEEGIGDFGIAIYLKEGEELELFEDRTLGLAIKLPKELIREEKYHQNSELFSFTFQHVKEGPYPCSGNGLNYKAFRQSYNNIFDKPKMNVGEALRNDYYSCMRYSNLIYVRFDDFLAEKCPIKKLNNIHYKIYADDALASKIETVHLVVNNYTISSFKTTTSEEKGGVRTILDGLKRIIPIQFADRKESHIPEAINLYTHRGGGELDYRQQLQRAVVRYGLAHGIYQQSDYDNPDPMYEGLYPSRILKVD
jgi:hypothetical protein